MLAPARLIVVSLVAALMGATLVGCAARGNPSEYAGEVADDVVALQAPALSMPSVDLDAGFAPSAGAGASTGGSAGGRRSTVTTAVALTGIGSVVRVTSVSVRTGDDVRAGQVIARLDSVALDANVTVAKAGLATARAQVGVLDDALDTVTSSRATLASKRAQVNSAAAQLATTRATLSAQLAGMKALLAKIEAMGAVGRPPVPRGGGLPTGTVPPTRPAPPTGTLPQPARLRAGIAKLTAAIAKIDAGLAQVAAGRAKLSSASAKLVDARTQLTDLRVLARVGIDAAEVGVGIAEYQRGLAVLRSPADGLVVSVATVGEILSPGATVARVRRREAPRVTTWVAPDQLSGVTVGSSADVSADWFPRDAAGASGVDTIRGRVSSIGTRAEYPPTAFATSEIHLTRAVRIEITLPNTAEQPPLPPGATVDVRFLGK